MIDALEPRDIGDIINDTFGIYGRNFIELSAIAAVAVVLLGIISGIATLLGPEADNGNIEYTPLLFFLSLLDLIVTLIAIPLMNGAIIHAVSEQHFRHPVSFYRAYGYAWGRLRALIVATVICYLAVFIMAITIIGIPLAIYFGIRWAFFYQAVLLEGYGPIDALSRSSALVKDNWWRVLGIWLVVIIIGAAINVVFWAVLRIAPTVGATIGSTLGGILAAPVVITAITLLYYDLRVRKEGYNPETMAKELDIETGSVV